MTERILDWRPQPPRLRALNEPFRLGATAACTTLTERRSIRRTKRVWLDQGQEGACTGFGAEHVLASSPYPVETDASMAQRVYYMARERDEWPGEDYEGSSVNGAMHAERDLGRIDAWYWARTTQEARHGLSYHGAGEAGTNWYTGMFNTDADGFIHTTGQVEGGHAYCVGGYGWLNGGRYYTIDNSWGPGWGFDGSARIWEEDFAQLLAESGEFAVPKKVRA